MITTVLFDLDGTLLPMDNDEFTKFYFGLLCKKLAPYGLEPEELVAAIWSGVGAMVKNDNTKPNEQAFWERFEEILGDRAIKVRPMINDFYSNEFCIAKQACGFDQDLVDLVHDLKEKGYRVALATNPIFPAIATQNRIRWAGLEPEDFELYTTYENIGCSKPNPEYYREVLRRMDVAPENAIMIGNDATEDMVAREIGMQVYLLTDNLLNKQNLDISQFPNGNVQGIRELLL